MYLCLIVAKRIHYEICSLFVVAITAGTSIVVMSGAIACVKGNVVGKSAKIAETSAPAPSKPAPGKPAPGIPAPAPIAPPIAATVPASIAIEVSSQGFIPNKITVKQGVPVTLVFTRTTDKICAKEVAVAVAVGDGTTVERPLPLKKSRNYPEV